MSRELGFRVVFKRSFGVLDNNMVVEYLGKNMTKIVQVVILVRERILTY